MLLLRGELERRLVTSLKKPDALPVCGIMEVVELCGIEVVETPQAGLHMIQKSAAWWKMSFFFFFFFFVLMVSCQQLHSITAMEYI